MRAATPNHPAHRAFDHLVYLGSACMWVTVFWALLYLLFAPTAAFPVREDPTNHPVLLTQPTLSGGCDYHYASWPNYGPAQTYYQGSPSYQQASPTYNQAIPTYQQASPSTEVPDLGSRIEWRLDKP